MTADIFNPIEILAGVQPSTDSTAQATLHYTSADKIRFVNGLPEKIGGWSSLDFEYNTPIIGCPRNIYSFILGNIARYLLATSTSLYSIIGQQQINMTPVITSATVLTNPFATNYGTLANNPLTTTIGTGTIVVADTAHKNKVGDTVKLSGAASVNGISNALINSTLLVTAITVNSWTFVANGTASSSGAGGGAAVVRATRITTVTHAAHGYDEGFNINITGATEAGNVIGGIPIAQFNTHHQIRNVTTNSYDLLLSSFATSSVSAKGNSASVYPQFAIGLCDSTVGQGYGLGRYGVGRYGVSGMATNPTPPRIWSFDRFGDLVIFTPGDQLGLYSWDGSTAALPQIVTNSPTAINYAFVTDNIAVTLGAAGVGNRIKWCDQGNLTVWADTPQNQAGEDDIEGSDEFTSHVSLRGFNLLFTKTRVYTFRYIKKPFIFETKLLDKAPGLIARNARIAVNGIGYWMGQENFYMYSGGNVSIIPSNSTVETTLKKYIFDNITPSQKEKAFCWYNKKFNEIWWHYPSADENEPDMVARLNIKDLTWTPDTMQRNAAEYPDTVQAFPYMVDDDAVVFQHENGYNDNGAALNFSLSSKFFIAGEDKASLLGLIPDSIQTANTNISVTLNVKNYPQAPVVATPLSPYTVTPTTQILEIRTTPRFWQYQISGAVINQFWRAGAWMEKVQRAGKR